MRGEAIVDKSSPTCHNVSGIVYDRWYGSINCKASLNVEWWKNFYILYRSTEKNDEKKLVSIP